MNNTRLATALHIMSIMAQNKNALTTSDWIAGSIQINPVMIRKEIAVLKKAGLVESVAGKEGGSKLTKSPNKIKLSDVYKAVRNSDVLGKKNQQPNPYCPVGKKINKQLDILNQEAESNLLSFLNQKTLADFCSAF